MNKSDMPIPAGYCVVNNIKEDNGDVIRKNDEYYKTNGKRGYFNPVWEGKSIYHNFMHEDLIILRKKTKRKVG